MLKSVLIVRLGLMSKSGKEHALFPMYFDFEVPTALPGVDTNILDPRNTYADPAIWEGKAQDLAARFIKNFTKYTGNDEGKALVAAGPQL